LVWVRAVQRDQRIDGEALHPLPRGTVAETSRRVRSTTNAGKRRPKRGLVPQGSPGAFPDSVAVARRSALAAHSSISPVTV
jgi:hypothetical protein